MSEKQVDSEILRQFSPLDGLKRENIAALAKKTVIRDLASGRLLFRAGDSEKRTFYLISGTLELTDQEGNTENIKAGSKQARYAIEAGVHIIAPECAIPLSTPLENLRAIVEAASDGY